MFKHFRDKIAVSGITVLMIGVALLIFTFVSAYGFLTQNLSIIPSGDLAETFGGSLAPLITTCIRIMYLGVMGWVASLVTIRGVTIISQARGIPVNIAQNQIETRQETEAPQKNAEKTSKGSKQSEQKPQEAKPSEPELVILTPEKVAQPKPQ